MRGSKRLIIILFSIIYLFPLLNLVTRVFSYNFRFKIIDLFSLRFGTEEFFFVYPLESMIMAILLHVRKNSYHEVFNYILFIDIALSFWGVFISANLFRLKNFARRIIVVESLILGLIVTIFFFLQEITILKIFIYLIGLLLIALVIKYLTSNVKQYFQQKG